MCKCWSQRKSAKSATVHTNTHIHIYIYMLLSRNMMTVFCYKRVEMEFLLYQTLFLSFSLSHTQVYAKIGITKTVQASEKWTHNWMNGSNVSSFTCVYRKKLFDTKRCPNHKLRMQSVNLVASWQNRNRSFYTCIVQMCKCYLNGFLSGVFIFFFSFDYCYCCLCRSPPPPLLSSSLLPMPLLFYFLFFFFYKILYVYVSLNGKNCSFSLVSFSIVMFSFQIPIQTTIVTLNKDRWSSFH